MKVRSEHMEEIQRITASEYNTFMSAMPGFARATLGERMRKTFLEEHYLNILERVLMD